MNILLCGPRLHFRTTAKAFCPSLHPSSNSSIAPSSHGTGTSTFFVRQAQPRGVPVSPKGLILKWPKSEEFFDFGDQPTDVKTKRRVRWQSDDLARRVAEPRLVSETFPRVALKANHSPLMLPRPLPHMYLTPSTFPSLYLVAHTRLFELARGLHLERNL